MCLVQLPTAFSFSENCMSVLEKADLSWMFQLHTVINWMSTSTCSTCSLPSRQALVNSESLKKTASGHTGLRWWRCSVRTGENELPYVLKENLPKGLDLPHNFIIGSGRLVTFKLSNIFRVVFSHLFLYQTLC